jgi:hypothetical protein
VRPPPPFPACRETRRGRLKRWGRATYGGRNGDDNDDDDKDGYVYRRGGNSDRNFTPSSGPDKDDDISNPKFGLSVDKVQIPGVKSQKISIKKLYKEGFRLSFYKGHI